MNQERKEYLERYRKENLRRIPLDVTKEMYEDIRSHADRSDRSVNGYIKYAVTKYMDTMDMILRDTSYRQRYTKEDLIKFVVSDQAVFEKMFVPAIISSDIDIVSFIYQLLDGDKLGSVADSRLSKYADDLKYKRTLIKLWNAKNEGNYTIEDVPQWVFDKIGKEIVYKTIEKQLTFSENSYDYTRMAGEIHFNLFGYKKLILYMEDRKIIGRYMKEKWMSEIEPKATESQ